MSESERQWAQFCGLARTSHGDLLDCEAPVYGARAPGRLDVMGGVGDYSGSVVLESTLALATFVAVQERADRQIRMRSIGAGRTRDAVIPLEWLLSEGRLASPDEVNGALTASRERRWSAYVAGCLYMLAAEGFTDLTRGHGMNILVQSNVPIGAGVSSSAALEVSVMTALTGLFGIQMDGMEIARLCQAVENRVVCAPCGIMDQVTCALGREDALLALKCQPHDVLGYEAVPPGWRFVGIDSGVKHSVGGRAYAKARIGAFMGYAIARQLTGDAWDGYLCNLDVDSWNAICGEIPEELTGEEFTRRFGPLGDPVSRVIPEETYRVRACTEHPILENARVREFLTLMELAQADSDKELMVEAGRLMVEAHRSYSERVDLGSAETDLLVELAMREGPANGVYGAKITGGGSGGTVAILCGPDSDAVIDRIRSEYGRCTNTNPLLMKGSSAGAAEFGVRRIAD